MLQGLFLLLFSYFIFLVHINDVPAWRSDEPHTHQNGFSLLSGCCIHMHVSEFDIQVFVFDKYSYFLKEFAFFKCVCFLSATYINSTVTE